MVGSGTHLHRLVRRLQQPYESRHQASIQYSLGAWANAWAFGNMPLRPLYHVPYRTCTPARSAVISLRARQTTAFVTAAHVSNKALRAGTSGFTCVGHIARLPA